MVNPLVRHARARAVLAALFVLALGTGISIGALVVSDTSPLEPQEALFFINVFKFIVGASALAAAGYFELGPEFHQRGIATRWLPPADVPFAAILGLLVVGVSALLTSITIFSRGVGEVLFGRTLGFAILGAGVAGMTVYLYAYSVAVADNTEP